MFFGLDFSLLLTQKFMVFAVTLLLCFLPGILWMISFSSVGRFRKKLNNLKVVKWVGEVTGCSNWSDTYVHSTSAAGGGYIGQHGGYVSGPSISVGSSVVDRNRFFIRTIDGAEQAIDLAGTHFPVRDGQTVTAIYTGLASDDTSSLFKLFNHATHDTAMPISSARLDKLYKALGGRGRHLGAIFWFYFVTIIVMTNAFFFYFFSFFVTSSGPGLSKAEYPVFGATLLVLWLTLALSLHLLTTKRTYKRYVSVLGARIRDVENA